MEAKTQAAQSLRDDPTFDSMSWAEKLAEARFAAQGVGLEPEIATLEEIVGLADILTATPAPLPGLIRDKDPKAPATLNPAPVAPLVAKKPSAAPVAAQARAPSQSDKPALLHDRQSILYRFKISTGVSDAFIAELLGMPRSTVQACIARRVKESLTDAQKQLIRENLEAAKAEIANLLAELGC